MMRDVPHPLMIILAGNMNENGILVSSFNTATLFPVPIVTFNIKLPSSTYSAIKATGRFSVLAPERVDQAKTYSQGIAASPARPDEGSHMDLASGSESDHGLLPNYIFRLECQWLREKSIEIGDHIIMVGQVLSAHKGHRHPLGGRALIYSNGQYRYAGDPIKT